MIIKHSSKFKKDLKKFQSNKNDLSPLMEVVSLLKNKEPLPPERKNHNLIGNYVGFQECHIKPDWLLIYKYEDENTLYLYRTGTHSNLFT